MNEDELTPPVKVGDILEDMEVISTGKRQEGVIKHEGYIIFVSNCAKGDTVDVEIEKVLPKFGIGKNITEVNKNE